jgi:hypothetical protein
LTQEAIIRAMVRDEGGDDVYQCSSPRGYAAGHEAT